MPNLNLTIAEIMQGDTPVLKIMKGDVQKWPYVPYDAEVEFLETDGNAYVDTGFTHNQDTRFVCRLNIPSDIGTWKNPFGSYGGASGSNKFLCGEVNGSKKLATRYDGSYHAFNISAAGDHTFDLNKNVHKVDNTTYTYTSSSFSSSYAAILFGVTDYNGNSSVVSGIKIYYFQIYDNGALVRDYIPVRKNGVGYLYDKISRQLFGNAGSGAFVVGPDK